MTPARVAAALLAALGILMFATVADYGMSGDEGVQHRYGLKLLRWYLSGGDASMLPEGDITYYGGFFEIAAEAAAALSPLDVFETRHVVTVFFALAALVAAWRLAARAGGEAAGLLAVGFLALTPPFYGHAFNNPKDIPFAGTFAVGAATILLTSGPAPRLGALRLLAVGVAIGLTAGVRVAGLILVPCAVLLWTGQLFIASPRSERARGLVRVVASAVAVLAIAWLVMLAFWPPAWSDPFRHPVRAWSAFSSFWSDSVLLFGGREVVFSDVARSYLPTWFALTMPETYVIALAAGLVPLVRLVKAWPLDVATRLRLWHTAWIAFLAVAPVAWQIVRRTPLYDGLRHFLFVMPFLAALAGIALATFWRVRRHALDRWAVGAAAALAGAVTLVDMVQLHPYQSVYFNRLVAGGLRHAASRYETDYWCLTYKEGSEWLLRRFAGAACHDKVRVAGHSTLLQTSYYFRKTEDGLRLFKPVGVGAEPHYVMATTRFGDHLNTPGRVVHTVQRQKATLMWLFETQEPPCELPSARVSR